MIWCHPEFEAQLCHLSQTGHFLTPASVVSSENWGYSTPWAIVRMKHGDVHRVWSPAATPVSAQSL